MPQGRPALQIERCACHDLVALPWSGFSPALGVGCRAHRAAAARQPL